MEIGKPAEELHQAVHGDIAGAGVEVRSNRIVK
jgi:hypothetical protein